MRQEDGMTSRKRRTGLIIGLLLLLALGIWFLFLRHKDAAGSGGNASAPWVPGTPQSLKLYYIYVHAHPNSAAARSSIHRCEQLARGVPMPLTKESEPFLKRLRELYPEVTFTLWWQDAVSCKEGEEMPFQFGPSPDDPLHFQAKFKVTLKRLTRAKVEETTQGKFHYIHKDGRVDDSPWQAPLTGERQLDVSYAHLTMPDDQDIALMIGCIRDEQASP
jgi:hypothetical protein